MSTQSAKTRNYSEEVFRECLTDIMPEAIAQWDEGVLTNGEFIGRFHDTLLQIQAGATPGWLKEAKEKGTFLIYSSCGRWPEGLLEESVQEGSNPL